MTKKKIIYYNNKNKENYYNYKMKVGLKDKVKFNQHMDIIKLYNITNNNNKYNNNKI